MSKVELYVYDLSGGLAKALSLRMTGKQIDGVWHTSVVIFGKEIFYGQGISTTPPGRSHHGKPLQVIDFGETEIDEDTFNEYLDEIRDNYTADKYHLLDFNCNSFTNDVIGFLTGQHIPTWIRDLPVEFLSTPFGASLRPTIDNMFRRPTPGTTPPAAQTPTQTGPPPDISNLLIQAVAQRAASTSGSPYAAASTVAAPVHISTNTASLNSLLESHKAAVVLFTSANCGPCRVIEPAFEDFAREKGGPNVAFVKVSLDGMGGQAVASQYGVRATPTFLFFLSGEKVDELKGADRNELKTRVDLLLYQAFPPHPHTSLDVPCLKKLSTQPILYEKPPDTVKLKVKLQSATRSLDSPISDSSFANVSAILDINGDQSVDQHGFDAFTKISDVIGANLPVQELFPLLDLWRHALLNKSFATQCAVYTSGLINVLKQVAKHVQKLGPGLPKALALTSLRLEANVSADPVLLRQVMQGRESRSNFTQILVAGLLHEDTGVRTSASTLVFNVGTHLQRSRRQAPEKPDSVEDGDWEVEVLTAILESLSTESDPGIVHRLVSAFGFIVMLSPWFAEQTGPLLEVLEAQKILNSVVESSKDAEVKKLAKECIILCGSS